MTIGIRSPTRDETNPLAMFEKMNVAVKGRKASPACMVEYPRAL
jgi:hypothetical protein